MTDLSLQQRYELLPSHETAIARELMRFYRGGLHSDVLSTVYPALLLDQEGRIQNQTSHLRTFVDVLVDDLHTSEQRRREGTSFLDLPQEVPPAHLEGASALYLLLEDSPYPNIRAAFEDINMDEVREQGTGELLVRAVRYYTARMSGRKDCERIVSNLTQLLEDIQEQLSQE